MEQETENDARNEPSDLQAVGGAIKLNARIVCLTPQSFPFSRRSAVSSLFSFALSNIPFFLPPFRLSSLHWAPGTATREGELKGSGPGAGGRNNRRGGAHPRSEMRKIKCKWPLPPPPPSPPTNLCVAAHVPNCVLALSEISNLSDGLGLAFV